MIAAFFNLDVDLEMFFAVGIMMAIKAIVLWYWKLAAEGGWLAVVEYLNWLLPTMV